MISVCADVKERMKGIGKVRDRVIALYCDRLLGVLCINSDRWLVDTYFEIWGKQTEESITRAGRGLRAEHKNAGCFPLICAVVGAPVCYLRSPVVIGKNELEEEAYRSFYGRRGGVV